MRVGAREDRSEAQLPLEPGWFQREPGSLTKPGSLHDWDLGSHQKRAFPPCCSKSRHTLILQGCLLWVCLGILQNAAGVARVKKTHRPAFLGSNNRQRALCVLLYCRWVIKMTIDAKNTLPVLLCHAPCSACCPAPVTLVRLHCGLPVWFAWFPMQVKWGVPVFTSFLIKRPAFFCL